MKLHRTTPAAMELWRRGAEALAKVENAGCRIDKLYLENAIADCGRRIVDAQKRLTSDKDFRAHWTRRFGEKTNPGSYDQLSEVMFKCLGFKSRVKTESGDRESAKKAAFEGIKHPIVQAFFEAAMLIKASGTFLANIRRELVQHDDGLWYVHPSYNLNRVITFRSSCDSPNYQQNPKRDPAMAEIVRRCYIPRPGQCLGESDEGQIEVRVGCPVTKDPNLIRYVMDPTTDMHRDMTCQIFKLTVDQVKACKALRNLVKGAYVFATFYGSYYGLTAKALWEEVDFANLKLGCGKSVRQHLTDIGFVELGDPDNPQPGTWVAWIRSIDEDFWGRRFAVYSDWKDATWNNYLRDGGFSLLTGFAINAPLDKKQVVNSQIQGPSFHLVLWSMIRVVEWLEKYRMKTRVIGEIHDCINYDMNVRERDDVFHAAGDFMTKQVIKKFAPWMTVPLVVEHEVCPIDEPWYNLHALKEVDGSFVPADMDKWTKANGPWAKQCVA